MHHYKNLKNRCLRLLILFGPFLSSCNGHVAEYSGGAFFEENFDSQPDWNIDGSLNKDCGRDCLDSPLNWDNYYSTPAVGNLAVTIQPVPSESSADRAGGPGNKAYIAYYNNVTYSGGAELSKTFPNDYQELYLRARIKTQPGWKTAADSSIKLLRIVHYDRTGSVFDYFAGGNGAPMAGLNWATNARYRGEDGCYISWFRCDPQSSNYICPQPPYDVDTPQRIREGVTPGAPGGFADGQWHRYDIHVKMNTRNGSTWNRDGVYEFRYDGLPVVSYTNVQWKYAGSDPVLGWNTVQFGGNSSNPYIGTDPQWVAFDDIVISTVPIP